MGASHSDAATLESPQVISDPELDELNRNIAEACERMRKDKYSFAHLGLHGLYKNRAAIFLRQGQFKLALADYTAAVCLSINSLGKNTSVIANWVNEYLLIYALDGFYQTHEYDRVIKHVGFIRTEMSETIKEKNNDNFRTELYFYFFRAHLALNSIEQARPALMDMLAELPDNPQIRKSPKPLLHIIAKKIDQLLSNDGISQLQKVKFLEFLIENTIYYAQQFEPPHYANLIELYRYLIKTYKDLIATSPELLPRFQEFFAQNLILTKNDLSLLILQLSLAHEFNTAAATTRLLKHPLFSDPDLQQEYLIAGLKKSGASHTLPEISHLLEEIVNKRIADATAQQLLYIFSKIWHKNKLIKNLHPTAESIRNFAAVLHLFYRSLSMDEYSNLVDNFDDLSEQLLNKIMLYIAENPRDFHLTSFTDFYKTPEKFTRNIRPLLMNVKAYFEDKEEKQQKKKREEEKEQEQAERKGEKYSPYHLILPLRHPTSEAKKSPLSFGTLFTDFHEQKKVIAEVQHTAAKPTLSIQITARPDSPTPESLLPTVALRRNSGTF